MLYNRSMEYENVGVKAKSRQEYCGICSDPVYRNDRLDLGKFVLHEACFRCLKCGLKLTNANFATYGDALLCKPHYHQLFQVKGNYSELARTQRYAISGSTERLIQAGEITEEEAEQMMLIQAEVDTMVEERRGSSRVDGDEENYANGRDYAHDDVMQEDEDDSHAYSYSYGGDSYGGEYRYHTEYDDEAEEEEEQHQRYAYRQRGNDDDDDDEYQNKLD